jgi:hypothetical protein
MVDAPLFRKSGSVTFLRFIRLLQKAFFANKREGMDTEGREWFLQP